MEKVLIINAQAVQTLIIARSLKKSGYSVDILCNGKDNYGYHTKYARKRHIGPECKDEDKYVPFLIELLKDESYATIIPMDDDAAVIVSKFKKELSQYTNVLMPEYQTFCKAYDKNELMSLCREKGYPHPRTVDLSKEEIAGRDEEIIFDPFLKEILRTRKEQSEISDIIETIQEKQFEVITKPERANFILQGCAGSGKIPE